jgi:hypothetical protein
MDRARNVRFWRRSAAPPRDPLEATRMAAADALREAHEGRMILERAKRSQRQGRRGLARRSASMPTSVLTAESAPAGHVSFRGGGYVTEVY